MNNEAHGDFQIEVSDNIVFGYPQGSFNEEGIRRYYEDILHKTQHLSRWAYLVQPNKDFALIPQANQIVQVYLQLLIENGCIAIGIRVQSMLTENIAEQLKLAKLVSLKISDNTSILEQFLREQLTLA
jgi:hypothetical protein